MRLPLARALHLADLAQIEVALEGAHAEDEQHAVDVVDLMLHGARQQVFAVHFEPLAVLVLGANADLGGADDLLADIGEAEAALFLVELALLTSMVVRRLETPTCGAARPMPCEA